MKDDYLVIAAILLGALFLMRKASAGTTSFDSAVMPYIGNNGSIMTADSQYIYDGKRWWIMDKSAGGYVEIPGQP